MKTGFSIFGAALLALTTLSACRSPEMARAAAGGAKAGEAKDKETALKRAAFERDLPIAREKLSKAKMDLADQEHIGQASLAKAKADLELTQTRLKNFDEKEAPNRLAMARLNLNQAQDRAADSKEELEQLELMYKEQDLADKTREIVIRRARRELDRSQERLRIQGDDLKILEERTLPHERAKLALEVADKERDQEKTARSADAALLEKRIALMSAEAD